MFSYSYLALGYFNTFAAMFQPYTDFAHPKYFNIVIYSCTVYIHEVSSTAISIFPMEKQDKLSCFCNFVIDSAESLSKRLP